MRSMRISPTLLLLLVLPMSLAVAQDAKKEPADKSGFLFRKDKTVKHSINLKEVQLGGREGADPRKTIPAIRKPKHVPADKAPWLTDDMRVIGLSINGESRAYPIYLLQVHEMVDDVLGGVPVAPNY